MANAAADGPCDAGPTTTTELIARAKAEGLAITYVNEVLPAGLVDLFVYQPNTLSAMPTATEISKFVKNYFELPDEFQPISGVSGLIIAARRASAGGRKIRQLRIMGHGHRGIVRIGSELVQVADLADRNSTLVTELAKLKEYLDVEISVVILDHCLAGSSKELLTRLSEIWGGVAVRGFLDYQVWEHDRVQVGQGPYQQCRGNECRLGVETVRIEAAKSGQ